MSNVSAPARDGAYAGGVMLLLAAGLVLSSGGLIMRQIETVTGWQIQFYRSLGMTTALQAVLALQYRGRLAELFRAMGWPGLIAGGCLAVSMIGYVFAIKLTTVANAMFVISAGPFISALLGWLLLREAVRPLTWSAMAVAAGGIAIMVADSLATGGLSGILVAAFSTATFAVMIVMLRRQRDFDMLPALTLGAVLAGLITALASDGLAAPPRDIGFALLLGVAQMAAGATLIMLGTRRVPAAQVSLLLLSESMLAPLWVWLFVAEAPTQNALIGGVTVLGAVTAQAIAGVLRERRVAAA